MASSVRWIALIPLAAALMLAPVSPVMAQNETDASPQEVSSEQRAVLDQLRRRSPTGVVSETLRDFIGQLDTPRLRWALKIIQNTGEEVRERDFSWQIGLRVKGSANRCGGILISSRFILTAAHCLDRNSVGAPGPVDRYKVSDIEAFRASDTFGESPVLLDEAWPFKIHDNYKAGGPAYSFDAALARLASPISNATTAPVGKRSFGTGPAVTSGWGDHPSGATGVLRAVVVPVVDTALCRDHLPSDRWEQLGAATICTVDEVADACARDSGGPLVVGTREKPQTIGIVSWGDAGCGVTGPNDALLGAYTRTSSIADWVLKQTGDASAVTDRTPGTLMDVVSIEALLRGIER